MDRKRDFPIRVLNVVTQMNRAGMENRLMDIYRHLDREVIQFDFYTFREEKGDFDDEILNLGGEIFYNKPLKIFNIMNQLNDMKKFFLNNNKYTIVHSHLNQWNGMIMKASFLGRVTTRISHSRTSIDTINIKNIIKNIVKLYGRKYGTHYFAVSQKAGEWLYGKRLISGKNYYVWPNAIEVRNYKYDETLREEYRNQLGLNSEKVIIHVGNIRPEKNHKFILKIFAKVSRQDNECKLLLVGKDYLQGEIQQLTKILGINDKVIFLGSRTDVSGLLQASDLFLFPSVYEGFPGAVLEAQVSGLPCIISNVITEEVCITPNVKQLSLDNDIQDWVNAIFENIGLPRIDQSQLIIDKGFDIRTLVTRLQNFYVSQKQ